MEATIKLLREIQADLNKNADVCTRLADQSENAQMANRFTGRAAGYTSAVLRIEHKIRRIEQ